MSGLRPALRMARRDVRRSPGRSLLVVLMVALPVSGAAFLDVVLRTTEVKGAERIPLELDHTADARVVPQVVGNPVLQRPDTYGNQPSVLTGPGEPVPPPPVQLPPTDPRPLLPAGSRVITDQRAEVPVRTASGLARAAFRELDVADPLAQGLFTVVDGRAPRTRDEVAVSAALLETLDQEVGTSLAVTSPERSLRIVGVVRPISDAQGTDVAVALPGAMIQDVERGTATPSRPPCSWTPRRPSPGSR